MKVPALAIAGLAVVLLAAWMLLAACDLAEARRRSHLRLLRQALPARRPAIEIESQDGDTVTSPVTPADGKRVRGNLNVAVKDVQVTSC
jgi:hypothetical protein